MNSKESILGFWCGIILTALLVILLRVLLNKKLGKKAPNYDERQAAIRGKGFQLAYMTALLMLVLGGIAELSLGISWCSLFTFAMIVLWPSICVFTTYCVIKDAYFTLRAQRKQLIIIMAVVGLINLGSSISHIVQGRYIIENSQLSTGFVNLLTGACCLYLALFMFLWTLHERRQENEE